MSPGSLRALRQALGLTQKQLGAELGISNIEVYRKERGMRNITRAQELAVECLLRRAGVDVPQHWKAHLSLSKSLRRRNVLS